MKQLTLLVRIAAFSALLTTTVGLAAAGSIYTTTFNDPPFVPGDVNGQDGWGNLSNSPTVGAILPTPAGAPAGAGPQSLHLTTEATGCCFGVASGLHSPRIDPAGEPGAPSSTGNAVNNHLTGNLLYRTPDAFTAPSNGSSTILGLNPSFTAPLDPNANRYAFGGLVTNGSGGANFVLRYFNTTSTTVDLIVLSGVQAGTWYQLTYDLLFIPGLNGDGSPNDIFRFTVSDANGVELGSQVGSTWEAPWSSGSFGGGTGPRGVNGFDFLRNQGPAGTDLGYLGAFTIESNYVPEPGSAALFALGGMLLLVNRRLRRS